MAGSDGPGQRPRSEQWRERAAQRDRAARIVGASFLGTILASVGLVAVYAAGGQTQVEGVLLFLALGSLGLGLGVWAKRVIGPRRVIEDRYPPRAAEAARQEFARAYSEALGEAAEGGRRRFLVRLLGGAAAALGVALLVPLRSLGPEPGEALFRTAWREGSRLVDIDGVPIAADQVRADEVVTVFPAGAVGDASAQAVLIGTRPGALDRDALPGPTVGDLVCYSKICTHAGCPVGLYRAAVGELLCPCHQSTFDVNDGARVLSGPTGRPLPQLPLGVDGDGYLVALGDFSEPVGPSFWNMHRDDPLDRPPRGDA